MIRWIAAAVGLALAFAAPAWAQGPSDGFWIADAFEGQPRRGPAQTKGVVVFLHGTVSTFEAYKHSTPTYVRLFLADGWDVLRHNRAYAYDRLYESEQAILRMVRELKQAGYRRIVLTGESRGAWFSIVAAARVPDVHAVVSTAPGGYGDASIGTMGRSAIELADLLTEIKSARVMVFFFDGDPRENVPGGRGEPSRKALTMSKVPFAVIDRPPDLPGHTANRLGRFNRRYGECILQFVNAETLPPGPFECDLTRGTAAGDDVPRPAELRAAKPGPGTPAALAAFAGQWYGDFLAGGGCMLTLTALNTDSSAKGVYACAAVPGVSTTKSSRAVEARLTGDALAVQVGDATLTLRARRDTTLQGVWQSKDGKPLDIVMRRKE